MIAFIEGKILSTSTGKLIVKTFSGLGYEIKVNNYVSSISKVDEEVSLFIYTHMRDDEISLYGFITIQEKDWFEMLIKTSGVGPKSGLSILSILSVVELEQVIDQNNITLLSKVPGIGKKTAAKLCLDLKDRMINLNQSSITSEAYYGDNQNNKIYINDKELASALKNMGFQEREIRSAISKTGIVDDSFEKRFKKALSLLASTS